MPRMVLDGSPVELDEVVVRLDVFDDRFDKVVEQLEKQQPQSMGDMDPAIFDHCRFDHARFDVLIPLFDGLIAEIEKKE